MCNRSRGDGTAALRRAASARGPAPATAVPASARHLVVVLCGPPGAGKTTAALDRAHRLDLAVYDRDEPRWDSEHFFATALAALLPRPVQPPGREPASRAATAAPPPTR